MTIIIFTPTYYYGPIQIREDFSGPRDLESNEKVILEVTPQSNITMIIQKEYNHGTHFFFSFHSWHVNYLFHSVYLWKILTLKIFFLLSKYVFGL